MSKKIFVVLGARPHFTKAAQLCKLLNLEPSIDQILVLTGQHYNAELAANFLIEFDLPEPKYNLNIGSGSQSYHYSKILERLDPILKAEQPELVLVFGDTNSTGATALAATFNNIPVAHVESGLREFDKTIPEEKNKLITDSISDIYFVPTKTGIKNLSLEGKANRVYFTGDVVVDYILSNEGKAKRRFKKLIKSHDFKKDDFVFFTCHRANNTIDKVTLESILSSVTDLPLPILFPMHPRTYKAIKKFRLESYLDKMAVVKPLSFWDTQAYLFGSKCVVTDSGGIIKEAYLYKKPILILQEQIEWVEIVQSGWARYVDVRKDNVLQLFESLEYPLEHPILFKSGANKMIVEILLTYLNKQTVSYE